MSRTSPVRLTFISLLLMALPGEALGQTEGGFVPPDQTPPPLVTAPPTEVPEEEPYGGDTQHLVAITWSPLHLVMPVVELTGAYRLTDELDAAAILGLGWTRDTVADIDGFLVFEAGGQFRYYPLGYFEHGMQLGAEVLFIHLTGSGATTSGSGSALSFGPFIGYKVSANIGFTFELQLGATYSLTMASASSGGQTATQTDGGLGLLLNIGFGWAF